MTDDAPAPESAPELAARAAQLRVAVVGAGIAGLVAAADIAALGMHVTVFEADAVPGGVVRRGEVAGISFDAGAESFATRGGHVRALIDDLGLADRVVDAAPGGAWLAGIPAVDAAPLPVGGILGIPANPFADDVRRIIGWAGAWRAYLDRLRPPLTVGHERSLGALVRSRMGRRVLDRLVAPVTTGVHSSHPDDIDTDAAAPGLNAALTRTGSLSGAVADLLAERAAQTGTAATRPGAAVQGLAGGMATLVDALIDRLGMLGAEVRTGTPAESLERGDEGWTVAVAAPQDADAAELEVDAVASDPADEIFDAVLVAADEATARHLLAPHVSALDAIPAGPSPRIEIVTLVLDAPALDAAPRGSGVLTVPGSHTAKALTHSTAKWPWLAETTGGSHVVRVSFGAQGEDPATAVLDDDGAARLAVQEASALLGVPLDESMLRGAHRSRFTQSQPATSLGAAERRAAAGRVIAGVPGLAATGAWLSGTGLAQVVPHARAEAERLRHALLWG
ncbi:protoporphyrinogen oxidase [Microbacterium pseudoresistens]|uniref:Oxygen-dependent protoporphyrinogen oxidase n=1 Tax=Microbacterium pseudoresistens TaxID=640634 RepID=A0A7Y9JM23_9MICO|nr:oxygen-dependent protoporphyrinogen oxidase [Microbacterium pseudoresistens]